jgi:hypothetical protein
MSIQIQIKNLLLCSALTLSLLPMSFSQNTAGPFDLIPRIAANASSDSTVAIAISNNPFDIIKIQPALRADGTPGFSVERPRRVLSAKDKEVRYRQFLFIAVLTILVIMTLVITIFRILIEKVYKAFLNDNLLNQLIREKSAGITIAYVLLYLVFLINAGFFLFLVCKHYEIPIADSNLLSLLICIGSLSGFFLLKHALLSTVSYIFPVQKEVSAYNFTIMIFNIMIGFVLAPAILFCAYAPPNVTTYVIYGAIGLILATYLFRGLRGLFIATRFIAWHKFHFLLYLCVVELAPLLVVLKLLLLQRDV